MKSLYEQKANKCKHYTGTVNDACEAGVRYAEVRRDRTVGRGYNLPCFRDEADGCECAKREWRTDEEIKAEIEESHRAFEKTMVARKAIVDALGGPQKKRVSGDEGSILCPACGVGTLAFSRSRYNGHIHARCSTPGCVDWME